MSLYMIDHAEPALWQHDQTEKTLKQYSIAVLRELCVERAIQVDLGVTPEETVHQCIIGLCEMTFTVTLR